MDEHFELQLARLVTAFSGSLDTSLQAQLAELLVPVVEPLALTAARRVGLRDAEDFAAEAVWELITPRPKAPLPRICMWERDLGPFGGWVQATLRNEARSRVRRQKPALAPVYEPDRPTAQDESERQGQEIRVLAVYETPFSAADHRILSGWGAEYRLELPLLGGLWVKFLFDPEAWRQILSEYEAARGIKLPNPFVPGPLLLAHEPGNRISQLAPTLGYNGTKGRNKLWRRWERNHPRLFDLECLSGFRPSGPDP